MAKASNILMTPQKISRALTRIAHEILEHNSGAETLALIGIFSRGVHLARRIAATINEIESVDPPVGLMDIGMYRDDVHQNLEQPIIQRTEIDFAVRDKNIILVDDVLFTGRTTRAALDQIIDFGRPRSIQLAVLVDRGHRELPFKADYVGMNIPTAREDEVVVELSEKDGSDQVSVISAVKPLAKTKKVAKKRGEQ